MPFTHMALTLANLQNALAFGYAGSTYNSKDTLELFLFIVGDNKFYGMFLDYLKKEFSAENLEFWKKIEQYRQIEDRNGKRRITEIEIVHSNHELAIINDELSSSSSTREKEKEKEEIVERSKLETAKAIYTDYISTNAVHMINISSDCRDNLIQWYNTVAASPSPKHSPSSTLNDNLHNLFNEAQREIFNLMCSDSLLRFMRTPECQLIQKDFNTHYLFGLRTKNSSNRDDSRNESRQSETKAIDIEVQVLG